MVELQVDVELQEPCLAMAVHGNPEIKSVTSVTDNDGKVHDLQKFQVAYSNS